MVKTMAKKQKDGVQGQLLPWNAVVGILALRDQTKTPKHIHARSRQLIDECAEIEFSQVVGNYLYGGS